jgi:DNA (cytosine-5)-methyltransferase 1
MLKVLDLFSGIGGFSLGLESTGHFKTIAFVEKDKFCQKVLQKNFKNIPIEGDIRNVKGEKYKADVVTGGFPCQPFSVAGKRKGTDDDRYLWDETIRVVRECKPKYFIGENVEGLINIQQGMVLRQVQTDLEKEGFEVQCLIIPASGIGAWHQRKRVWIIGCNVSNSNTRFGIGENKEIQTRGNSINNGSKDVSNSDSRLRRRWRTIGESGTNQVWGFHTKKEKQSEQNFRSKTIGCDSLSGKDVPNSKFKRLEGWQRNDSGEKWKVLPTIKQNRSEMGSSFGCFNGKKEQQTWWQTQSELCGVPNGVSYELDKNRANRIKALGNSIVPQIVRELGLAIIEAENDR